MKGVWLRRDDCRLSGRGSSRKEPKAVLKPWEQTERAFLVGVEFRTRSRAGRGAGKTSSLGMPPGAQAARDHAASVAVWSSSVPADSPDFSSAESLDELRALAASAGAQIAGEFKQRRDRPDPATLIGKGKLEEIAGASASVSADVILFDHDLSPSQQRNIERVVHTRVIDRTQLILDIFARHARTREGQLQVELAQLEYLLRAIDDARVDHALNIALLRRREVVIEQNHIRGNRGRSARNFLQLAFADQRGRIQPIAALCKFAGDLRARARGQRPQLVERFRGAEIRGIRRQGRGRGGHTSGVIPSRLRSRRHA